jgi:cytochrome c2
VGAGVRLSGLGWRIAPFAAALLLTACGEGAPSTALAGGNAANGQLLLRQYDCGSCHVIPGVANARGNVGPPLENVGNRIYLAGMLPNTPSNMALWIRAPQKIDPLTAMPDLQVPEQHARDMTAYLQTLR